MNLRKLIREELKKLIPEGYEDVGIDYIKTKHEKLQDYPATLQKKDLGNVILLSIPYKDGRGYGLLGRVLAFDKKDGTEVANASYGPDYEGGPLGTTIDVRPD